MKIFTILISISIISAVMPLPITLPASLAEEIEEVFEPAEADLSERTETKRREAQAHLTTPRNTLSAAAFSPSAQLITEEQIHEAGEKVTEESTKKYGERKTEQARSGTLPGSNSKPVTVTGTGTGGAPAVVVAPIAMKPAANAAVAPPVIVNPAAIVAPPPYIPVVMVDANNAAAVV